MTCVGCWDQQLCHERPWTEAQNIPWKEIFFKIEIFEILNIIQLCRLWRIILINYKLYLPKKNHQSRGKCTSLEGLRNEQFSLCLRYFSHTCTRGSHNDRENSYTKTNYAVRFSWLLTVSFIGVRKTLGAVTHRRLVSRWIVSLHGFDGGVVRLVRGLLTPNSSDFIYQRKSNLGSGDFLPRVAPVPKIAKSHRKRVA